MQRTAGEYFRRLAALSAAVEVTDRDRRSVPLCEGLERWARRIQSCGRAGGTLFLFGNGANAGLSSHMAADFSKNGGVRAWAFTDPALLTAVGNDCGFEEVFAVPLARFAKPGDVVMALSSSGASPNILRAVETAQGKECAVATFSGFKPSNPLRAMGDLNFYVPHEGYALVEVLHHAICHCLLEVVMKHPVT
jgi:D-sedoheptulose 7-phosphate isomerase